MRKRIIAFYDVLLFPAICGPLMTCSILIFVFGELKFHDFMDGETKLNLQFDQIVKFEYYRISSIKGWLMLFSYTLPKCVYITYNAEDKVQKKFIGYLDLKDIKEISSRVGVELRIY